MASHRHLHGFLWGCLAAIVGSVVVWIICSSHNMHPSKSHHDESQLHGTWPSWPLVCTRLQHGRLRLIYSKSPLLIKLPALHQVMINSPNWFQTCLPPEKQRTVFFQIGKVTVKVWKLKKKQPATEKLSRSPLWSIHEPSIYQYKASTRSNQSSHDAGWLFTTSGLHLLAHRSSEKNRFCTSISSRESDGSLIRFVVL